MKNAEIVSSFVQSLMNKVPKKTQLTEIMSQVLNIEKEAAYRRLRGEVQFSFNEAIILAQKLNISIDEIALNISFNSQGCIPLQFPLVRDYERLNYFQLAVVSDLMDKVTQGVYSEIGIALSGVANPFFYEYEEITRFINLKYMYHNKDSLECICFEDISETQEQAKVRQSYNRCFSLFTHSYYIWDMDIIPNLIKDIRHFKSIRLINDENVKALKSELLEFLDNFELIASTGCLRHNENKVNVYVSDVGIEMSAAYLCTKESYLAVFYAFLFLAYSCSERVVYERVMRWIDSLKRCSTLISGTCDKQRVRFFDNQREIVNALE